jgi:hypothetical protein
MDATQKQRTRKVAVAHFVLSIFVIWKLVAYFLADYIGPYEPTWRHFWRDAFYSFQPQFLVADKLGTVFIVGICAALVPIWSFYFGWLYTKFVNWLNHFPVLGKRVF